MAGRERSPDACSPWWEAISARLDGEALPAGITLGLVDTHLAGCRRCQTMAEASELARRRARVQSADALPDLTGPIMEAVLRTDRERAARSAPSPVAAARIALLVAAALQALGAFWHLLGPMGNAAAVRGGHAATDHAVLEIALGVAFLTAALRPARAGAMLPMSIVAAVGFAVTGAADAARGLTDRGLEVGHALALLGAVALVIVHFAGPRRDGGPRRRSKIDGWSPRRTDLPWNPTPG